MARTWIDITRLSRGPTDQHMALTLAVRFSFDRAKVEAIKALVPWHDRAWSEDDRTWYASPQHLEALKTFARGFDEAMLIEGNRWEDLKTGHVFEQQELFGQEPPAQAGGPHSTIFYD
jgi:hypothetical protein